MPPAKRKRTADTARTAALAALVTSMATAAEQLEQLRNFADELLERVEALTIIARGELAGMPTHGSAAALDAEQRHCLAIVGEMLCERPELIEPMLELATGATLDHVEHMFPPSMRRAGALSE